MNGKPTKQELLSKPTKPIDVEKPITISQLVENFKSASFQSRAIGNCAEVYENMLRDKDRPLIFLGLAGSLIAAGLRKVIRDMIKYNIVDVIVSTGAILYQDFYQARGYKHYIGTPDIDDVLLRDRYIDRLYDTYVDEEKFDETDNYIANLIEKLPPRDYSSREILAYLGQNANDENSILYNAYKHNIPVFSPALCDSSIGIGYVTYYARHKDEPYTKRVTLDMIRDNYEILQLIQQSKKTSAIYIGGGTPKNWINDAVVMASYIRGKEYDGHTYIFQITTDAPQWGGLSGSTLKEAQSWGKVSRKATKQMAFVEASVALPLVVGYILERPQLYKNRSRLNCKWEGNTLLSLY